MTRRRAIWLAGALLLLLAHLCHLSLLWVEEAYPLAAAQQMLRGRVLYRDLWFDKPPLYAAVTLLWGAQPGWPLRVFGTLYVLLACWLAYRFGREAGGEKAGWWAAGLLAFSLTFYLAPAVMALAPDLLLVVPHLAAVYLAWRGQPFWSGVAAGIGLQCNTKAIIVLAACALWQWRAWPRLLAGFAIPTFLTGAWLLAVGAWPGYWQQVWQYGLTYSAHPPTAQPWREGLLRSANWAGFHLALLAGAALAWRGLRDRFRWLGWLLLSGLAVVMGWRFFPRYYFHLLPPLCVLAGIGWARAGRRGWAVAALLLVPLIRFGPRYVVLAAAELHHRPPVWSDLALQQESAAVAAYLRAHAAPTDTLLVWGYRPEVFVWSGLPAGTRFLDSQPLTGVLADRHLVSTEVTTPELAVRSRRELVTTKPTWIVDGLGPAQPVLAVSQYADLQAWLVEYQLEANPPGFRVYHRQQRLEK